MASRPKGTHPTWFEADSYAARRVGRRLADFLKIEAAGGIVLLLAAATALIWANSPWSASYDDLWHHELTIQVGRFGLTEPLESWVNDGLMVLFFFVVGLEIKKELVVGELRNPRDAALPAVAAVGGMMVPALIFVSFNAGGEGAGGWGIPMATDIAFAVGVVALLSSRVPSPLKVFLLTLAIVDDIGAILVIAVFYTTDLSWAWLGIAASLVAVTYLSRVVGIWWVPYYAVVGFFVWLAILQSGVHATIAGVIVGLLAPAKPLHKSLKVPKLTSGEASYDRRLEEARAAAFYARESVSVAERLEDALHPVTSFVIIPIFALANAGIEMSAETIGEAASSSVTLGIAFGLVVGKVVGVTGFTWLVTKLGLASLPAGVRWAQMLGLGAVAGIGFTVSLFVAGLAFGDDVRFLSDAKIGIVFASLLAAVTGSIILSLTGGVSPKVEGTDFSEVTYDEIDADVDPSDDDP